MSGGFLIFKMNLVPSKEAFKHIQYTRLLLCVNKVVLEGHSKDEIWDWVCLTDTPTTLVGGPGIPTDTPTVNWFELEIPIIVNPEVAPGHIMVTFE